MLLNKTYVLKEKVPSVENDSKLGLNCKRPPKKGVLNCCKLQVIFRCRYKLGNNFHFKDSVLQTLTSGVGYKFQCGLSNNAIKGNNLDGLL